MCSRVRHTWYLPSSLERFKPKVAINQSSSCNMQETLDPALTRPGRFDRRVAVPIPDVRGRLEILEHYLKVRDCLSTCD